MLMCESTGRKFMPDRWSRGSRDTRPWCPACHCSSSISDKFVTLDDALAMSDVWGDIRCSGCGPLVLNPRPIWRDYYLRIDSHADQFEDDRLAANITRGIVAAFGRGNLDSSSNLRREPVLTARAS